MKKQVTKRVRNLRRRTRNHVVDALASVMELAKRDTETDLIALQRIHSALREAAVACRVAWPTPEHIGINITGPGVFTVGN